MDASGGGGDESGEILGTPRDELEDLVSDQIQTFKSRQRHG